MKRIIIAVSISALALTACSSKTDANEKNFTLAIQQQLDKSPTDLCIPFAAPTDIQVNNYDLKKFQAIESAGLISGVDIEKGDPQWIQFQGSTPQERPQLKFRHYTLTAEGKKFYQETDIKTIPLFGTAPPTPQKAGALCYGKVAVDKVVKWTEPMQSGNAQVVQITYLYKIDNLADWAKNPAIQEADSKIKDMVDGASKKELVTELMLTNLGWEAAGTH